MDNNEKEGVVWVSADRETPTIANIRAGAKDIVLDESGIKTGVKVGPDPYDYIMSALGACTVITLHLYAQHKQWPLERVEVRLEHGRAHTKDCEDCGNELSKISQVTKQLRLVGDLTEAQRDRLKAISAKCPVQKTLQAGINIVTELVED